MSSSEFSEIFANNLLYFLNLNRMKPVDLARRLDVSESTVSRWLAGKTIPYMDKVDEAAKIFGIERSDLITSRNKKNHYIDRKTREVADEISENKELRFLFEAARDVGAGDLKMITELLKSLKRKERGDDGL